MELTIKQALRRGITAHKEGKLQEAEHLYRAILRIKPAHPDANHNLGVLAVSINKIDAALPCFRKALEANPKKEQFWCSYIDALIKERQVKNAQTALEEARAFGVDEQSLNSMAEELTKIANATRSVLSEHNKNLASPKKSKNLAERKKKEEAGKRNSRDADPSQQQLSCLLEFYQDGNLGDAEKLAMSITKDFPKHQFGWKVLGAILKQTGRVCDSLKAFEKSVHLAPLDAEAHSNLGVTLTVLGRLEDAEASHNQAIALKPDYAEAHYNLGVTLQELGKLDEAEGSYTQALVLKADYAEACNNLGTVLQALGRLDEAETSYNRAIALKPDDAEVHNNLGLTLKALDRFDEAEVCYIRAIALKPRYAEVHNNLGLILQDMGRLDEATRSYTRATALRPDYAEAYNNLGTALTELGRSSDAEVSYNQAITLNPDFTRVYWNLQGIQKTMKRAEYWIDKCLGTDENLITPKLMKAAFRFYRGEEGDFYHLMQSELKRHPYMRSFSWVFSLPNLPELHFNKFYFFDAVIKKSIVSKPFYEFGVWRATSFKYLIKAFKKGYGFDTFTGLPEAWDVGRHIEKKGTYTSDGVVPKIDGGKFIVGKFEDTLPVFFSKNRPKASVINFDADLYSSTICALNFSKPVIDKDTVLVFDEFLINDNWEHDEFKALNEFCSENDYTYEVVAVSFFTKQVAVKIIGL